VLNQEDKPKRHRSAHEILHETAILHSSVHRIIHRASNDVVFSCCLKLIASHWLINNLTVCNKSCYCFLLNRKLNNK